MRILLLVVWLFMPWFFLFAKIIGESAYLYGGQEVPAQEMAEKEIFIHIHSGLKTMPVRKVIGIIISKAEDREVKEIVGKGKHVEWDIWDIDLAFLKEKEAREFKWRYARESWNIQPMNEESKKLSFPMDKYIMGPAINMALGMIEGEVAHAEEILGRAEKLPNGRWQFLLKVVEPQKGVYVQKWLYHPETGDLIPQHFDHSDLDKVLASCVTAKGVDYSILKKNSHLEEFLKKASKADKKELETLSREEQIAFWINLYNATVLKRVAEKYPVKSVIEIKGLFDKEKLKVAGKALTLNDLRDYLLGKDFREDRVLFALVSGTKSSPPLRKEAYCGRRLEGQLEEDLKSFLNQPANLYVTEAGILLSPVLEPLAKEGTLRDFLGRVVGSLPPGVSKSLMDEKKEIKFMEYDWAPNARE